MSMFIIRTLRYRRFHPVWGLAYTADVTDRDRPRTLWRHRNFVLLAGGQTVSLLGFQVSRLALPLVAITTLDAGRLQVALLAALTTLPWLLVSLPAGVLVDRRPKRSTMLWCDVIRAAVVGSVPLAALFHAVTLVQLYAVALIGGALAVVFDSAALSYPPVLVEPGRLADANAKMATGQAVAQVAGPSLGGFLIALLGAARAVTADALSYVVSALSLFAIRAEEPPRPPKPRNTRWRTELLAGLRLVLKHPQQRAIVVSNAVGGFLIAAINAILLIYVIRNLHWSPRAAGLVFGLSGIGSVVGSLFAKRVIERLGIIRTLLVTAWFYTPCELACPLVPGGPTGEWLVGAAFTLLLVAAVVYNTASQTFRQLVWGPEYLGRVNSSIRFLQWGATPLGAVVAGALATGIGLRPALFVLTLAAPICPLVLWLSPLRTERTVPVHAAYASAAESASTSASN